MNTIVFFLEEPSAKAMLEGLLPRLLPSGWDVRFVIFEGKQDLEKQLPKKLKAWKKPNCSFVVLRDKDSGDCVLIRENLITQCSKAGKPETLIRIAIHELECWFIGDLTAVEIGLEIANLSKLQNKEKFRNPDRLANPSQELKRITSNRYQKISGSRAIGLQLSLKQNRSYSFNKFISGIKKLLCQNYMTP